MKVLISGLLVASLAMVFSYVGEMAQAQSLVLYLPFDEGSGDKTSDLSNNGNDGTLGNNPAWTEGKFKNALEFDGTDDYVETPTYGREALHLLYPSNGYQQNLLTCFQ
jgi:hypothetical protein